jgi:hypothetical protein
MSKLIKSILVFVIALLALLGTGKSLLAYTIPNFPTCSNPNGTLLVSYDSGTHGIVGSTEVYTGTDKVFSLENGNALQCFCASDNQGIQTNWWKISSLDQEEIQTLVNLGWYFVPDGSVWGLSEGAYMAQNLRYTCGGGNGGSTTTTTQAGAPICNAEKPGTPTLTSVYRNGSSATLTWTKADKATHYVISYGVISGIYPYGVPNTGNVTSYTVGALDVNKEYNFQVIAVNDCMPGDPSTQSGSGQVLGLATTGSAQTILLFSLLGILLTSTGYLLVKTKNNSNN